MVVRSAAESGKHTRDGIEVTLPASNQELASQIGTVRELVSRNLSRLHAEAWSGSMATAYSSAI
jgi:hypothetical protein